MCGLQAGHGVARPAQQGCIIQRVIGQDLQQIRAAIWRIMHAAMIDHQAQGRAAAAPGKEAAQKRIFHPHHCGAAPCGNGLPARSRGAAPTSPPAWGKPKRGG